MITEQTLSPRRVGRPPKPKPAFGDDAPDPARADVEAALMLQVNALIDIEMVSKMTTLSKREIARRVSDGRFPKPTAIGAMRKAWPISTIKSWISSQMVQ